MFEVVRNNGNLQITHWLVYVEKQAIKKQTSKTNKTKNHRTTLYTQLGYACLFVCFLI